MTTSVIGPENVDMVAFETRLQELTRPVFSTDINLDNYVTDTQLTSRLIDYPTTATVDSTYALKTDLDDVVTDTELNIRLIDYPTSSSIASTYATKTELKILPTIPNANFHQGYERISTGFNYPRIFNWFPTRTGTGSLWIISTSSLDSRIGAPPSPMQQQTVLLLQHQSSDGTLNVLYVQSEAPLFVTNGASYTFVVYCNKINNLATDVTLQLSVIHAIANDTATVGQTMASQTFLVTHSGSDYREYSLNFVAQNTQIKLRLEVLDSPTTASNAGMNFIYAALR